MNDGPLAALRLGPTLASAPGNPLDEAWTPPAAPAGATIVAWSGTLASALDAPHPHNWMSPGRDALDAAAPRLRALAEASGAVLLLAPHARHVLNDVPSAARYVRDHADDGPGLALLPAALLEPPMLADAEDHLVRILEGLGPIARLVVVEDARPTADGAAVERVPLGQGVLPAGLLLELVEQHAVGRILHRDA